MHKALLIARAKQVLCSCREQDGFLEQDISSSVEQNSGSQLLFFSSKDALNDAVSRGVSKDSRGRKLKVSLSKNSSSDLRTLDEDLLEIPYSALVPEVEFRNLLNDRGEIQVGDSVYCISGAGTFSSSISNLSELRRVVDAYQVGQGTRIGDKK